MENRRQAVIAVVVIALILLIIGGTVFYLVRSLTGRTNNQRVATVSPVPVSSSLARLPGASPTPASGTSGTVNSNGNIKTYNGSGFQIRYPKNWGILTCGNSQNFELDPTNITDQLGVNCNRAVKPVTFLVRANSCGAGQTVNLGGVSAVKTVDQNFVTAAGRGVQYQWCINTTPAVEVTHRVGTGTAFSTQDYSKQVEQIISSFRSGSGS